MMSQMTPLPRSTPAVASTASPFTPHWPWRRKKDGWVYHPPLPPFPHLFPSFQILEVGRKRSKRRGDVSCHFLSWPHGRVNLESWRRVVMWWQQGWRAIICHNSMHTWKVPFMRSPSCFLPISRTREKAKDLVTVHSYFPAPMWLC